MKDIILTNIYNKRYTYIYNNYQEFIDNEIILCNDYKTKKTAVLYVGDINTFQKNKYYHYKLFKDYDIFYCAYKDDIYLHTIKNDTFFKKGLLLDEVLPFSFNEKYNNYKKLTCNQQLKYLYSLYKIYEFLITYQKKNNIYYENIIHVEFSADVSSLSIIDFNEKLKYYSGDINGNFYNNHYINLNLVYGKQYLMFYFYNIISQVNYESRLNIYELIGKFIITYNIPYYIDNNYDIKRVKYILESDLHFNHKICNIKVFVDYSDIFIKLWDLLICIKFKDNEIISYSNEPINHIINDKYEYILNNIKNIDISTDYYYIIDSVLVNILSTLKNVNTININFKGFEIDFSKLTKTIKYNKSFINLNDLNKYKYDIPLTIINTKKYDKYDYIKFNNKEEYIKNILPNVNNININNIAFCFSGNIRTFAVAITNIKELILYFENLGYKVDLFYQIYKNDPIYDFFKGEYLQLFTSGIELESEELPFTVNEIFNNNSYCSVAQNVSQLYGYYTVFNHLLDYQKQNNIYYKYVTRIRYDHEIVKFNNIKLYEDGIVITKNHLCGDLLNNLIFNDRFAIGTQYLMYYYFNVISHINEIKNLHAESFMAYVLNNYNIKLYKQDFLCRKVDYQINNIPFVKILNQSIDIFVHNKFTIIKITNGNFISIIHSNQYNKIQILNFGYVGLLDLNSNLFNIIEQIINIIVYLINNVYNKQKFIFTINTNCKNIKNIFINNKNINYVNYINQYDIQKYMNYKYVNFNLMTGKNNQINKIRHNLKNF